MAEQILCPACGRPLLRCRGAADMPASQEYWSCARCGLNAHSSRLLSAGAREELRREYLAALEQRVADGQRAAACLHATGHRSGTVELPAALLIALGLGLGLAVTALLSRFRSD